MAWLKVLGVTGAVADPALALGKTISQSREVHIGFLHNIYQCLHTPN